MKLEVQGAILQRSIVLYCFTRIPKFASRTIADPLLFCGDNDIGKKNTHCQCDNVGGPGSRRFAAWWLATLGEDSLERNFVWPLAAA